MTEARQKYRINELDVNQLNRILRLIADRFDEIEGRRGDSIFKGNINVEADLLVKDSDGNTIHKME
jgi:hypothetical protein